MLTQAGHIRPSPLRGSPRGLSKPATSLRRFSRLRTPCGWPRPGASATGYSHDSLRMLHSLPSLVSPPATGKARLLSLNTQTPGPPRGACPCETKLIKNPVWMRHARDDVPASTNHPNPHVKESIGKHSLSGSVHITSEVNGRPMLLASLSGGDSISEINLFDPITISQTNNSRPFGGKGASVRKGGFP